VLKKKDVSFLFAITVPIIGWIGGATALGAKIFKAPNEKKKVKNK